ncbi:MAG: hypothetical protein IPJ65_29665 [Archangiaceae bacterium]|nr:hypothetical protein [Archangiaceae bacterium]
MPASVSSASVTPGAVTTGAWFTDATAMLTVAGAESCWPSDALKVNTSVPR